MTKLLISCDTTGEHHLVVSNSQVLTKSTIARLRSIVESGAKAIFIDEHINPTSLYSSVIFENESQNETVFSDRLEVVQKPLELADLETYGRIEVDCVVDRVFLEKDLSEPVKKAICERCARLRIPVNVGNDSTLSTFALLSSYTQGDLQVGVTTNTQGCKLASRIKREMVQNLPANVDEIIANIGELRRKLRSEQDCGHDKFASRASWLSQVIEYFPLNQLASVSVDDLTENYRESVKVEGEKCGNISLVGSGPGSLSMLTLGALNAIYNADIVLSDKLVPQEVLDTIPKRTELFIAKKFPGNAHRAQQELLQLGLDNLAVGRNVVRLKQGDPYIFGRGGEEYKFFAEHGYTPTVVPGLSSALVAPVVANIPTTQRGVSDQVLVCTGTGRNGKVPDNLPEFDAKRTVVFLMAIKKIVEITPVLTETKSWPADLPVCVIERAACKDQRVIRTRLSALGEVLRNIESRPPGLIVAGYSCEYLVPALRPDEIYRIEEHNSATDPLRLSAVDKIVEAFR